MSGIVPPIPPPLGADTGNTNSPNRVYTIPNDNINNTTTNNVAQNVVDENLHQLLYSRGDSHVTNVPEFDKEDNYNNESSDDDNDDDDVEKEEEEEEEEHLASADPSAVPIDDLVPSS
ncbi:hypothetical protein Tco_0242023 [Tanacetum coccineum]